MTFAEQMQRREIILTEGAVIERLRRDSRITLDPAILHAGLVYQDDGRAALEQIYRQYMDIGRDFDRPFVVCTPSWRANPERLRSAGFDPAKDDLIGDGFRFLAGIRAEHANNANSIYIGGLMGCRGDAYDPSEALSESEAAEFHAWQSQALADAGVDFLMAATLPAASEAVGLARAMAATHTPYIVSVVVRPDGTMLDGTPLHDLIARVDREVDPPPLAYMVNCTHTSVFADAVRAEKERADGLLTRLVGLQANTSAASPEELDGSDDLLSESPDEFARGMHENHEEFGVHILGGCCGTDKRHISALAERLKPVS